MEFSQIETFLAAAELLHFSKAAEVTHLSQPALSHQIRRLEADVGVKLFLRGHKHVTLTPAGAVFCAQMRNFVLLAAKAKHRVQLAQAGLIGHLRIGFISTAAAKIVPQLISSFRLLRPEVILDLTHALTAKQIEMLEKEQLDIGFFRMPDAHSTKLATQVIHREAFKLFIPSGHALAAKPRVSLQSLQGENFIVYSRKNAPGFHSVIMQALSEAGVTPSTISEATDMYSLLTLVSAGNGITLAPASVAPYKQDDVVVRDVEGLPMSEIAIAYRPDISHPAALAFIAFALSSMT